MEKLFTYGTLQDPKIQMQVFGHTTTMSDDVLKGYRKGNIELSGKSYYIAIPDTNSEITGKVLDASSKELSLMDEYETKAYSRIEVRLASGNLAWVYCQPR